MYTYQDFLEVGELEGRRMDFIQSAISEHKATELYNEAVVADLYNRHRNKTINDFQKLLYTVTGKAVPDTYSANYKLSSRFFNRFVTQENQYLLGNGVTWQNEDTAERLGDDFISQLQKAGEASLVQAVSFGFFNFDHLEVFKVTEFVPLWDEETGALRAGIRWWQIDKQKPTFAVLYEEDGYTKYRADAGGWNFKEYQAKRAYKTIIKHTDADGDAVIGEENYTSLPIVPLYGSKLKQSTLIGMREKIDSFDLIRSGFANDLTDCAEIYWILENCS